MKKIFLCYIILSIGLSGKNVVAQTESDSLYGQHLRFSSLRYGNLWNMEDQRDTLFFDGKVLIPTTSYAPYLLTPLGRVTTPIVTADSSNLPMANSELYYRKYKITNKKLYLTHSIPNSRIEQNLFTLEQWSQWCKFNWDGEKTDLLSREICGDTAYFVKDEVTGKKNYIRKLSAFDPKNSIIDLMSNRYLTKTYYVFTFIGDTLSSVEKTEIPKAEFENMEKFSRFVTEQVDWDKIKQDPFRKERYTVALRCYPDKTIKPERISHAFTPTADQLVIALKKIPVGCLEPYRGTISPSLKKASEPNNRQFANPPILGSIVETSYYYIDIDPVNMKATVSIAQGNLPFRE